MQFVPLKKEPRLVAGLDCAFSSDGERIFAIVIVMQIPSSRTSERLSTFEIIETGRAVRRVDFPYIPGLLSFREAPACLEAIGKLTNRPDLFLIDGQGIAHPRRLGLASHLGLFLDKPTVGCAKSRLIGTFEEPGSEKGSYSSLMDNDEVIGAVVRTRRNVKPLFVSVGNRCLLNDAIRMTLTCTTKYRLPEPTRLAHQEVTRFKSR